MDRSKKESLTTSQLLSLIRKSEHFSDVTTVWHDTHEEPVFCHFLYEVMEKHRMKAREVISRSGIERSYYYHILSGRKTPGRNIILRICLCIGASLADTNQLLRLSNQGVLYPKVRRDAAIIFAIEQSYTMQQTNDFLLELHEKPLYQEDATP